MPLHNLNLTVSGPVSRTSNSPYNNVEIIEIVNPPAGTYTFTVNISSTGNMTDNCSFALAWW
nr:hypothetical protein [bacterium]